jgi:Rod binding domain-containing protein
MADAFALPAPGLKPLDLVMTGAIGKPSADSKAKAKAAAQNFEAVFLNSMFEQMFTDIGGEGPFGGQGATGVWRSLLTDEYAKSFAKAGGVGMADQVYKSLLAQQEGHS